MIPDYVCWTLGIMAGIIVAPVLIYLCVKLATIAYYRGKHQAERLERNIDDPIINKEKSKPKGTQHGSEDTRQE